MPVLKLDIDAEAFSRLREQAASERRPIAWQAEVLIRRALGLPSAPNEFVPGNDAPSRV